MYGRLIILLLCITISLPHPQDISCFENNFAGLKYSYDHTALKSVQRIKIQQVYREFLFRDPPPPQRNDTPISEQLLDIFEGERAIFELESQQFPDLNPRQLTLYFDGQSVQAAIAHYNEAQGIVGNWTCRTFNESAPARKSFEFSASVNNPNPSPPITDFTSVQEVLWIDLIQDDKSCFKENLMNSLEHIKVEVDDCKKKEIFVEIKPTLLNNTEEIPAIVIKKSLMAGQIEYAELGSLATDVMNPRYLVMLYDGVKVQAAINYISQQHPSMSDCRIFNDTAPNIWFTTFASNVTDEAPFAYAEDRILARFLDPMRPWGEEQDLECFDIQFPPCNRQNTTEGNKKARIFVTHIFKTFTDSEEVEKFSVDLTEGKSEIVQIEFEFQNRTPRNLSLYLEDSVLHVGMGQLQTWPSGSTTWNCEHSSAIMDMDSEEVKTFEFLDTWDSTHHFLSFSWNHTNGMNDCANIALIFSLLFYTMSLQHGF